MSTVRGKQPGDIPGSVIYSVTGTAGAVSYVHPGPGKPGVAGVHSATPTATGEHMPCDLVPAGACWSSTLPGFADRTHQAQVTGEDALYRELESIYRGVFGEGDGQ